MLTDRNLSERGWSGPHHLLSTGSAAALAETCIDAAPRFTPSHEFKTPGFTPDFERRPWFKSIHVYVPEIFELISHPDIVSRLIPQLGPNIIAWGASLTRRMPGQVHRWHVDVEHLRWRGMTVFLGLNNSSQAGLKFIDGSHRFISTPQNLKIVDDGDALAAAKTLDPQARISEPILDDGEFVLFDGQMWHASINKGSVERSALIIQYTVPGAPLAIPLNWDEPIRWHDIPPPCVVVSGSAFPTYHHIVKNLPTFAPK